MSESLVRCEKSMDLSLNRTCVRKKAPWTNWVAGPLTWYAEAPYKSVSGIRTMVGYTIPHFHSRLRKGELLPQTPFWKFSTDGSSSAVYDLKYWAGTPGTGNQYIAMDSNFNYFSDWVPLVTELEALMPPATTKFVQQAAAAIYSSGHDTLTFLAELSSVKTMFMNLGYRLLKMKLPKNARDLANDWLEGRYGWRTFVYDIKSLNEALQNLNAHRDRYRQRKGYKSTETVTRTYATGSAPVSNHVITDKITTGIRGTVIADIEVPQFQFNPIQTGWELIPYSFVVDWFVSVGKALSAASFLAYASKYSASYGQYVEVVRTYSMRFVPTSTIVGTWSQDAVCTAKLERRTPCSVPLVPHFTLNLNPYKILDLVGMVVQRTKGG